MSERKRIYLRVALDQANIEARPVWKPMHKQGAFAGTDSATADCPVTERLCKMVLSLPMHPYMTEDEIETVCGVIRKTLR